MSSTLKLIVALPFVAVISGCVAGGNNNAATSTSEIEALTDSDINGDGSIVDNGAVVGAGDS